MSFTSPQASAERSADSTGAFLSKSGECVVDFVASEPPAPKPDGKFLSKAQDNRRRSFADTHNMQTFDGKNLEEVLMAVPDGSFALNLDSSKTGPISNHDRFNMACAAIDAQRPQRVRRGSVNTQDNQVKITTVNRTSLRRNRTANFWDEVPEANKTTITASASPDGANLRSLYSISKGPATMDGADLEEVLLQPAMFQSPWESARGVVLPRVSEEKGSYDDRMSTLPEGSQPKDSSESPLQIRQPPVYNKYDDGPKIPIPEGFSFVGKGDNEKEAPEPSDSESGDLHFAKRKDQAIEEFVAKRIRDSMEAGSSSSPKLKQAASHSLIIQRDNRSLDKVQTEGGSSGIQPVPMSPVMTRGGSISIPAHHAEAIVQGSPPAEASTVTEGGGIMRKISKDVNNLTKNAMKFFTPKKSKGSAQP